MTGEIMDRIDIKSIGVPESVVRWLFEVTQQIYGRYDPRTTFNEVLLCVSQFKQLRLRTRKYSWLDSSGSSSSGNETLILNIYGRLTEEDIPVLVWVPLEFPQVPPKLLIDIALCGNRNLKVSQYVDSQGNVTIPSWSLRRDQVIGQYSISYGIQEFIALVDAGYIGFSKDVALTSTGPPLPEKPPLPPKPPGKHTPTPNVPVTTKRKEPLTSQTQVQVPPAIPKRTYKHTTTQPEEPQTKNVPSPPTPQPVPDFVDSMTTTPSGEPTSKLRLQILQDFAQLVQELRATESHKFDTEVSQRKRALEDAISQFKEKLTYQQQATQYMHNNVEFVKARLEEEIKMVTDFKNSRLDSLGTPDPDDIAICDVKAIEQMYELVSRDLALTDAIKLCYDLLNKGLVELELYIKETRRLAREQFLVRVHIRKIASYL